MDSKRQETSPLPERFTPHPGFPPQSVRTMEAGSSVVSPNPPAALPNVPPAHPLPPTTGQVDGDAVRPADAAESVTGTGEANTDRSSLAARASRSSPGVGRIGGSGPSRDGEKCAHRDEAAYCVPADPSSTDPGCPICSGTGRYCPVRDYEPEAPTCNSCEECPDCQGSGVAR